MSGFQFSRVPVDVPVINTKYRRIVTPIPVPESLPILEELDKYESRSMHGQLPILWDKAKGFQVYDAWGNMWLDFTSTIFVTNTGHGNPKIIKAIDDVLRKPLLHTYTYASKERIEYIKYLIEKTPTKFEKAFLLSAGTEATECALKLMRLFGWKKGKKRPGIIAFEGNWHGRTMGAQMMGYNPEQKEWIGYLDPNIYHLPFPYPWRNDAIKNPEEYFLKNIHSLLREKRLSPYDDICGFILEAFQGWGAVFYPTEFVRAIARFAQEHQILVCFDEMQSGFGRTGKLFGYMHYGIEPDILCCGKGASSSLPLSIVLGSKEVMDLPEIGSMSSTHSANPLVCAAGRANMESLIEDGLIDNSDNLGKVFHTKLIKFETIFPNYIKCVLGKGLLAAIHFKNSHENISATALCNIICELSMKRGLLVVHTGRESIKLAPPLTINEEALLEGIEVIEGAIADSISGFCK